MKIKAKNYIPLSITHNSILMAEKHSIKEEDRIMMIADYEKAKKIIKTLLKNGKRIDFVIMGLDGDWSWNSCTIWNNSEFYHYDQYDRSFWAEPIIIVNYKDKTNEAYSCWKQEDKS